MAEPKLPTEEAAQILKELKDKGIVDLDALVRTITDERAAAKPEPRMLICNNVHNCLVVKEVPPV